MRKSAVLMIAVALGFLSGCASPSRKEYNPRMGLLDILARMEPANHSNSYSSVESDDSAGAVSVESTRPRGSFKNVSLQWPLRNVVVTSPFGQRGREFHEGLDLRAKYGTPVYAAHSGQVLYASDRIHGYGRMIVLKHSSGLATVYAHNSKLLVHKGQWVTQGQLISYSGNSGHSTGPHLHFEVREGVSAVNPMSLLPAKPRLARRDHSGAARILAASQR